MVATAISFAEFKSSHADSDDSSGFIQLSVKWDLLEELIASGLARTETLFHVDRESIPTNLYAPWYLNAENAFCDWSDLTSRPIALNAAPYEWFQFLPAERQSKILDIMNSDMVNFVITTIVVNDYIILLDGNHRMSSVLVSNLPLRGIITEHRLYAPVNILDSIAKAQERVFPK